LSHAVRIALGVVVPLALCWALLLAVIAVARPRGIDLREARRLVPDLVRLLRAIAADPIAGAGARRRIALLAAYLAFPFDLVPDFIPVLGYADDVIVVALVLRSVIRSCGAEVVDRHWTGTPSGLAVVRSLAGVAT
jgi:uncharacterized membrane protein YkvA (DUF1232 family)